MCILGFDTEGWSHQEEAMVWCLRQRCVHIPPTQRYRCLKFTGISLHLIGRHPLGCLKSWHDQMFGSPTYCSGCHLLGMLRRDVTAAERSIGQKLVIKLWAGEVGGHILLLPCFVCLAILFPHKKVRVIFNNLLSWKEWKSRTSVWLWLKCKLNFLPCNVFFQRMFVRLQSHITLNLSAEVSWRSLL